jgi:hypothetical protein
MTHSRTAPLLGVLAVVLLVVGNELTKTDGDSPSLHAPTADYSDAIGSSPLVLIGCYAVIAAWLALGGFFAAAAERLRRFGTGDGSGDGSGDGAARSVAAGGALAAAVGIAGAAPLLAATVMTGDGDLSPETAKALLLMNAVVFVVGWFVTAVPIGMLAWRAVRVGALGAVLGWSGVVLAIALALGSLAVWWVEGVLLLWLVALLWIAAVGVRLSVTARRAPTSVDRLAVVPGSVSGRA